MSQIAISGSLALRAALVDPSFKRSVSSSLC